MSDDFGKQFVEARNVRGVTLEEAAEATKIKVEYLSAIEENNYNFDLSDIYVRGFIKIYAKYLQMDVDAVMANCSIKEFEVPHSRTGKKVSYNTIVLNEKEKEEETEAGVNDSVPLAEKLQWLQGKVKKWIGNKYFFGLSAAFVILLLLFVTCRKVFSQDDSHEKFSAKQIDEVLEVIEPPSILLIASGDVKVVVKEKSSERKIFSGHLEAGAVKKIPYASPIQVFYDSGEFLLIKRANGEPLYPQPGRGAVAIK
jgi:cytoskeletal protein RodZ